MPRRRGFSFIYGSDASDSDEEIEAEINRQNPGREQRRSGLLFSDDIARLLLQSANGELQVKAIQVIDLEPTSPPSANKTYRVDCTLATAFLHLSRTSKQFAKVGKECLYELRATCFATGLQQISSSKDDASGVSVSVFFV